MNLDSFLPPIEGIWNISILILLAGVLLFYFGKLICSVKIWEFEKSDYYFQGFSFFLGYVAIPFIAILVFYQFIDWVIPFLPSLIISLLISGFLGIGVMFNVVKFRIFSKFQPEYEKKVKEHKTEEFVKKVEKTWN